MTLTSVPGIRVGHATHPDGGTGCTVVLGPFRAAVEVPGLATGTRELGVLSPHHLVPQIDAVLLTGGSAFGLAAADGVMRWLEAEGRGYDTGAARVPIVPAAVIYDLKEGRPRPDADLGRAACEAASAEPVSSGRVGVGAGATVGKMGGAEGAAPGGVGSASLELFDTTIGALCVVNSVGNVTDPDGSVIAGGGSGGTPSPAANTTLAVIGTDAPLSRVDLGRLARMAVTGMARRIDPVHTPFDGDVIFAVSTGRTVEAMEPSVLLGLGVAARDALEAAIVAAVRAAGRSGSGDL